MAKKKLKRNVRSGKELRRRNLLKFKMIKELFNRPPTRLAKGIARTYAKFGIGLAGVDWSPRIVCSECQLKERDKEKKDDN